ncbi:heterogeneous nuclear ribonucleoprotein 1-like [Rhodamnia argentea]|uniref:Heterogeneous nuclear ribonucleoprotein 1-like n=1 Tax=Rhodamnia argentea TaxID=178133 RepID=A0A8B8MW20_9MYRT|nr:heterogeneous nuclear ribonucleoprotein 1-like [Rhodamnia argentea]
MEMDHGKLFVGGISWDTNEDRLRDYFQNFGEVVEAVIMRDRATGRARGFGFVVFADPAVAERVVMEKHVIDGRSVEAKKAVPRDDHNILIRNNRSISGSPAPTRTKKIFVGGLPSTITESDFKKYFDQFGTITDVVVMYDHNTQRPRGFGFITYNSEDAVDRVLYKTFHELKGKLVEVKRAVPKELSPGPSRSPLGNYNHGMSRVNGFLNGYTQGYGPNSVGDFGARMDGRLSPVTTGLGGVPPFTPPYAKGLNNEPGFNPSFGANANILSNLSYGKMFNSFYNGTSRYNTGSHGGSGSILSPAGGSFWGNGSLGYSSNNASTNNLMGSGSENAGLGSFNNAGTIWGPSSNSAQGRRNSSTLSGENFSLGSMDGSYVSGAGGIGRNSGVVGAGQALSYPATSGGRIGTPDLYESSSLYGDLTWQSSPPEPETSGPFGYGLGNATSDVMTKSTAGYVGYGVANRQSTRGIAT